MNNKNVWQHNKLVPMDKKKTAMSVFSNSQNGPPEFSTPVWEKDGENPQKRGGRERKEGGVGQGNTSGNKLEKEFSLK